MRELHDFLKQNDRKLSQRGMTLGKLYGLYGREHTDGFRSMAFYRHYRLWKRRVSPSMHMVHIAGDSMEVDYTDVHLRAIDVSTGTPADVELFLAILEAGQMTYVEAVASQKVEDFISCCENALHYFGGAQRAVMPDNMKSAATEQIKFSGTREVNLNQIPRLAGCGFITRGENNHITGSTGTGMSYIASALGH